MQNITYAHECSDHRTLDSATIITRTSSGLMWNAGIYGTLCASVFVFCDVPSIKEAFLAAG